MDLSHIPILGTVGGLTRADTSRLRAAEGYLELGMMEEAGAELEEIAPENRALPDVLAVRINIYRQLQAWDSMRIVAKGLCQMQPQVAQSWLDWAYATRRADSLPAARAILQEAKLLHPKEGAIAFNLACYAAQLGELTAAKSYLTEAIALEGGYKLLALEDRDLEPIW